MIEYRPIAATRELAISKLHSLYYFQLAPNDPLEGESHDFWEMVYIDVGEAQILSGEDTVLLKRGEAFLHEPNRYHRVRLVPGCAPNILIVSFALRTNALDGVKNRRLPTTHSQRRLLSLLLEEGAALYGPLLDCHRDLERDRREDAPPGALQMILDCLEMVLISLIRQRGEAAQTEGAKSGAAAPRPEEQIERLKDYMRDHLDENLTFEDCCRYLDMSGTALKTLFRAHSPQGVMHCYQWMRACEARRLLRSGRWNVTEVSTMLNYSSCQAFSAQFRRLMGASPTDYLRRVAVAPELITNRSAQLLQPKRL